MAELQQEAAGLKNKAWANSTTVTYQTHLRCYLHFCDAIQKLAIPADSELLQLYVTYLAKVKKLKYSSILQYLNIVPHVHKLSGFSNPISEDYQLKYLLMGVKRTLGTAQTPVDAITPRQLLAIKSGLHFDNVTDLAVWCACLIAFYGLLRPGNVTVRTSFQQDKDLRRIDITSCSWGYLLRLRHTKTIQFREKELDIILPYIDNELCPATAIKLFLAQTPYADLFGPLLLTQNNCALSYHLFRSVLHRALLKAGIASNIQGHSFRRGGATWLSRLGVPLQTIKQIGYWSSDAVNRYIDPCFSKKLHVIQHFGTSLCQ